MLWDDEEPTAQPIPSEERGKVAIYVDIMFTVVQKMRAADITTVILFADLYEDLIVEMSQIQDVMRRAQTRIDVNVLGNMLDQCGKKLRRDTWNAPDTMFLYFAVRAYLYLTRDVRVVDVDDRRIGCRLQSYLTSFMGNVTSEDFESLISPNNLCRNSD